MPKGFSNAFKGLLEGTSLSPVYLVTFKLNDPNNAGQYIFLRYTTGPTWVGNITYTHNEQLLGFSDVLYRKRLARNQFVLRVSMVDSFWPDIILTDDFQNKRVSIGLTFLDGDQNYLPETDQDDLQQWKIFEGLTSHINLSEENNQPTAEIYCNPIMSALERSRVRRYTPQEQRRIAPSDTGLDQLGTLPDAKIVWE